MLVEFILCKFGAEITEEAEERSSDDGDEAHTEVLLGDLLTAGELDEFDDTEQASLIKRSRLSKSITIFVFLCRSGVFVFPVLLASRRSPLGLSLAIMLLRSCPILLLVVYMRRCLAVLLKGLAFGCERLV